MPSSGAVIYGRSLRANFRALWTGSIDYSQFFDAMASTIQRRLTQAGYEGAGEAGILPAELSPGEKLAIQNTIVVEMSYVDKLGTAIEAGSKKRGGKLGSHLSRVPMWVNRYEELRMRIRTMAAADMKVMWVLGPTEKHCRTCPRLNGKVKRNSYWLRTGILPRVAGAPYLECAGFR